MLSTAIYYLLNKSIFGAYSNTTMKIHVEKWNLTLLTGRMNDTCIEASFYINIMQPTYELRVVMA